MWIDRATLLGTEKNESVGILVGAKFPVGWVIVIFSLSRN